MMTSENGPNLERRIAELEARVAQLEGAARPAADPGRRPVARPAPTPRAPDAFDRFFAGMSQPQRWVESSEGWLGRVGVALMALGFVFLYRYAVDQGWLTPPLRIATGLLVGIGLTAAGHQRFAGRERYRQILMGGGIVILFITGLAASELYHLVPGTVALLFHAVVAATAFAIATQQKDALMATIGAAGALVPPAFLLNDSVPGTVLWLYLAIIIAWTGAIYAARGWRTFFALAALFGIPALIRHPGQETLELAAAVIALAIGWIAYAALPLVRAERAGSSPTAGARIDAMIFLLPCAATVGIAFAADYILSAPRVFGATCALAATGIAVLAASMKHTTTIAATSDDKTTANTPEPFAAALFSAVALLALAAITGMDAPYWTVAIAAIGMCSVLLSRRLRVGALVPLSHALFLLVVLQLLGRIEVISSKPTFDSEALSFAVATLCAAYAAFHVRREERKIYLGGVFIAVHTLLATELTDIPGAAWLGSASWFVIGSALVLHGLSRSNLTIQRAGMLSLAMLVARLFLYDLANAGTGVRIILFLACGVAFLALSYRFRARQAG